jgi:hypothetical protein
MEKAATLSLGRMNSSQLRLGNLGESAESGLIADLYYWDKVEEAYDRFLEAGAIGQGRSLGFFRIVEGEALTRKHSQITDLNENLQLESHDPTLGPLIVEVCNQTAKRLGWDFRCKCLVSILVPEADVPWHSARYGYMMDKYPFDKVCLPANSVTDQNFFARVLAHEYAHVITLNFSLNRAPHWVEEGVSTHIESPIDKATILRFASGESEWKSPHVLENAFAMERRNGENRETIRDAYDQAHILVDYLHSLKGDEGLGEFLSTFGDHSSWEEIKIQLGQDPADEALRHAYKMTQEELFAKANPQRSE